MPGLRGDRNSWLSGRIASGAGVVTQPLPARSAVASWVVYDVANTIFWTGVVGLAFPLWLTKELSGNDATLGYTLAATMAVVLVMSPIIGAISDQAGRRVSLLIVSTMVCVAATLLLGNGGLLTSLAFFALAMASMELGVILYNALLPDVSTPANRGRISGLGTGIGYVGSFIAVGVAISFTEAFDESRSYVFTFRVLAVLFLLFALPIFFFLRERPKDVLQSTLLRKVIQAFSQLNRDLRRLDQFPGLRSFLVARFFYGMGINTAVAFAVVYASSTLGLSDREIQAILMAGVSVAIPSGILWGTLVDRIGAKPVLRIALAIWIATLLLAVGMAWLSWSTHLWWGVGCLTAVAIAGGWTADRPFMLSFTPSQNVGEFFGLHGMVGKFGRVLGPFMWALISSTLGLGQPAAILSLIGCLVVSYVILSRTTEPARIALPDLAD